ncbi:MAG: hypothetical protein WBD31_01075 [Rubripirellula sp.]
MAGIGELSVSITARTQKATKNIRSFRKSLNSLPSVIAKSSSGLAGLATSAAGLIGVATIGNEIRKSFSNIDGIGKTADKLGIATEKLSALRFAAEENGVAASTTDMALQRMVRRIAEAAQGSGEAVGALDELGVSAARLASMSPDQQFATLADAMKGVTNQGDRVRLSMKLFDSEGVALVNTLRLGSAGLKEYEKEAQRLGHAITGFDVKQVEAADQSFGRVGKMVQGITNNMAIGLAPIIESVANKTVEWGTSFKFTSDTMLGGIESVAKGAAVFGDGINFWLASYKSVRAYASEMFSWLANTMLKSSQQLASILNKIPGVQTEVSQFTINFADEMGKASKKARAEADKAWTKPLWSDSIDGTFKELRANIAKGRAELEKAQMTGTNSPFAMPNATGLGAMIARSMIGANQFVANNAIGLAKKFGQATQSHTTNPGVLNANSAEGFAALRSSMNRTGVQEKMLEVEKKQKSGIDKMVGLMGDLIRKTNPAEILSFEST